MARPNYNQFIGPLKPGQKPPTINYGDKDEEWTVLDLLKSDNDKPAYSNSNSTNQLKAKKPKKFIRAAVEPRGKIQHSPTGIMTTTEFSSETWVMM